MTPNEAQSRVKANVWKALAQAEVDLSTLPKGAARGACRYCE